jgi:CHAT domain-containing protein
MTKRGLIIVNIFLFLRIICPGQCPANNLEDRLKSLSAKKVTELLVILDSVEKCPKKNVSTYSSLLTKIGKAYYDQGDFLKALKYYRPAIDLIVNNANGASVDFKLLPGRYYWLAAIYDSLNLIQERSAARDSCVTIALRLNAIDRSSLSVIYTRIEDFFDAGDYSNCINYAKLCEKLSWDYINATKNDRSAGEYYLFGALSWRIESLFRLGKFDEAEQSLSNKLEEYQKEGLKNYYGITYSKLADVERSKGHYSKAFSYSQLAFRHNKEVGYNFSCKQDLNSIGYDIYFNHFNDYEKALHYYKMALDFKKDESLRDSVESLNILNRIANLYLRKGLYDSTFKYFKLAFDKMKPGMGEEDFLKISTEGLIGQKKIHHLSNLLIDKGDAYKQKYLHSKEIKDLNAAISVYKISDRFLDKIKTRLSELESKLFWRGSAKRLYENAIEACYLKNNLDDAFYFFEKSRASLLNDQLIEQKWQKEEDILKQTQLKKNLLRLERIMDTAKKSSPGYTKMQNEWFDSKQKLEKLQEKIKTDNPLYYQSFLDTSSVIIKDVQQKILNDHQALVEIFSGDSAVYTFVITASNSSLRKINKKDFDSLANAFGEFVSDKDRLNRDYKGFINLSHQLYQLVFENSNLPAGRIIISPGGKYFPFEALVTNIQQPTYFIEDHAVSYTYSVRYLLNNFTNSSQGQNFLGFAPVQFSNFPSLPGSDLSLNRVKNYFSNSTSLLGRDASRNNFLRRFYNYKIIQLYTHATDSAFNGEPAIYFSDSTLLLSDLLPQNKPITSLIVLSACQTASGKLYSGEGVFSFNRGFAALGIPSAVSNLWQVDDKATYKLTELFYKYVSEDDPLDIALQKAKKEFMAAAGPGNKLPYYWAAPILVGKSDKISFQESAWKWIALIVIIIGLAFWLERKWFKRSS